jgi:hypothetical protein
MFVNSPVVFRTEPCLELPAAPLLGNNPRDKSDYHKTQNRDDGNQDLVIHNGHPRGVGISKSRTIGQAGIQEQTNSANTGK